VTISFSRLTAATILLVAGVVVALTAFGVVVARLAVAAGLPPAVTPADIALLDDLAQLVPFVGAFAAASIVAAVGLVSGSSWANRVAAIVSAAAVGAGFFGITLLILGHDPFSAVQSSRALDGVGIVAAFSLLYGAVFAALAFDGKPGTRVTTQAAA
jgi:hypothetical protein